MKNLDTIFAVEFGQLLENFLFSSADRDRQRKVICSCLGLKNENQLAQIFAGYDTPTTAGIFILLESPWAMLFAFILMDERLTMLQIVGAGLIMIAAIAETLSANKNESSTQD